MKEYKMTIILEEIDTGVKMEVMKDRLVKDLEMNINTPYKPLYYLGKFLPERLIPDGNASIKLSAEWEQE